MTRQHPTSRRLVRRLVRRLRPAPERFAAAAALQNPGLLLQLQAADEHAEEPSGPPPSPTPLRWRSGVRSSIGTALRRRTSAGPVRRRYRLAATSPCLAQ